ncbi:MAG: hypothetical protein LBR76_01495 [Oscillospiraceae bacterium]|nr:hypothetical protein [Oscillospiraceae bacterium]
MRVKTLRTIAIALIFVLIDIPPLGKFQPPDLIGLVLIFICSVMMTDRAGRFARSAAISAAMMFLEVVRIFGFAGSEAVSSFLSLLYLFLTAFLVITLADGVSQFSASQGLPQIASLCDTTGHVYTLAFVSLAAAQWFPSLEMILWLASVLISIFVIIMFIYFYSAVVTMYQPEAAVGEPDDDTLTVQSAGHIEDGDAP